MYVTADLMYTNSVHTVVDHSRLRTRVFTRESHAPWRTL